MNHGRLLTIAATAAMAAATTAATAGMLHGPGGEPVEVLPTVDRQVAAPQAGVRCSAGRRTANAVDLPWRAGARSGLLAQLRGGRSAGDWDLLLLDRRGRELSAARGFGAREAVSATVPAGARIVVRACRLRGGAARVPLRIQAVGLGAARRAAGTASFVRVKLARREDAELLRTLGLDLGEDGGTGSIGVVAYGDDDLRLIRDSGLPFETVIADLGAFERSARAKDAAAARPSPLPSGRTTYRSYDGIQAELKKLIAANPGVARATKLPLPSSQGREISGIEIADDVEGAARDGRPTFALVGVHHAREWPAAEMAMELINDILASRDAPEIKELLRTVRIVAVPVQNPDGYAYSQSNAALDPDPDGGNTATAYGGLAGDHLPYRRKTCGGPLPPAAPCDLQPGADSNRNYGPMWGGRGSSTLPYEQDYQGTGPWSEPETEGYHRFLQQTNATMVLSLHNVLGAVLRPPGVLSDGPPPDEAAMKMLGDSLAKMTGYASTSFSKGLGYDGSGITEDWAYGALSAFTYTIEVGPSGGQFHGDYARHVVEQWEGPKGKGGMRLALRTIAAAAADKANHSTLTGRAPASAVLKLSKAFTTLTRKPCVAAAGILVRNAAPQAACLESGAAPLETKDAVRFEMTVPASSLFRWHVPPSTRPFEARAGKTESYAFTCESGGKVADSRTVTVQRGQELAIGTICGAVDPPAKAKKKAKRKKHKAKRKKRS
jgi:hypothetical protein